MTVCPHCDQPAAPAFTCEHCQGRMSDPPVWQGARTYSVMGIGIAAAVAVSAAALIWLITAWTPLIGALRADEGDPSAGYVTVALGLLLSVALMLPAGVLFVIWLWRARKNLDAFPNPAGTSGAGWAIGGWFVPIVGIFLIGRLVHGVARYTLFRGWAGAVAIVWCVTFWMGTFLPRFTPDPPQAAWDSQHAEYMRTTLLVSNLIEAALLLVAAACIVPLIITVSRSQEGRIARAKAAEWYVPPTAAVPGAGLAS